MYNDISSTAR